MNTPKPPIPTGSTPEAQFAQIINSKVNGPMNELKDSSTVKVDRTSKGIFLRAIQSVPPEVALSNNFPFKLTLVSNASATPDQIALFTAQGIDINDVTLQISSGIVGVRPYLNTTVNALALYLPPANGSHVGNFEYDLVGEWGDFNGLLNDDTPVAASSGTCIILDNTQPTLIYGIPAGSPLGTNLAQYNQIVLNQNQDSSGGSGNLVSYPNFRNAAFWIETVDDPIWGVYLNLWGCMYSDDPVSIRTKTPIPTGSNIISLGSVMTYYPGDVNGPGQGSVFQAQAGNLINRFPEGTATNRGRWSVNYTGLPAGHTTLNWYPGDTVVDDSVLITDPGGSGFQYYLVWSYTGNNMGIFTVAQTPSAPDWEMVGMSK